MEDSNSITQDNSTGTGKGPGIALGTETDKGAGIALGTSPEGTPAGMHPGLQKDRAVLSSPDLQRKGWIVLCALLFAGIIVIMNQFKVPTFMGGLAFEFFEGDMGATGWLMSIIAVAGVVTAFPAAFLINRFGPRAVGMVGIGFMVAGCAVGALTTDAVAQLFVGRILEGIGVALMGTVATTIISMYFPREKAGLPMGIWNLWYVIGASLAYNIGVPIALAFSGDPHNWHVWWWFCDALALLAFIVFALIVQKPRTSRDRQDAARRRAGEAVAGRPSIVEGFKVWRMWVFGLGFCLVLGASLCVFTWVPTYVQTHEMPGLIAQGIASGLTPDAAEAFAAEAAGVKSGWMSAIPFLAAIPVSVATGFLLKRFSTIKARNVMVVIASLLAFAYTFAFMVPYEFLPYYLAVLGLESGYTSGVIWSMVPITMPKRITMPVGMAIIIFFQGMSNLLCTPVVGYVVGNLQDPQWGNVAPLVFCCVAAGMLCWIVYGLTRAPRFEEDAWEEGGGRPGPRPAGDRA
ncbi:MAG: MFS transporter [Coriobacteriaceae bacterium]|jgi:MFS family permease|nr:MFS transporter [Coriobacteriaceae bacterium]